MTAKYRIIVEGMVSFSPEDQSILDLLKGPQSKEQFEKAIQELEEEASDVGVSMEYIGE